VSERRHAREGTWLLIHKNAHCSARKRLADGNVSVEQCQEMTLSDPDCGLQMYSNDDMCRCVKAGFRCDFKPSAAGNNVYEVQIARTMQPAVGASTTVVTTIQPYSYMGLLGADPQASSYSSSTEAAPPADGTTLQQISSTSIRSISLLRGQIVVAVDDHELSLQDERILPAMYRTLAIVSQQPVSEIEVALTSTIFAYTVTLAGEFDANYITSNLLDVASLEFVFRQNLKASSYEEAERIRITDSTAHVVGSEFSTVGSVTAAGNRQETFSCTLGLCLIGISLIQAWLD